MHTHWQQAYEVGLVTRPLWWARLEQISAVMGSSRFLAGDHPTIPDVMLYPHLEYMRTMYDMFIPPHNRALYAWYERFGALPGVTPLQVEPDHFELYIAKYGRKI
jgi:glutathione S-transferase